MMRAWCRRSMSSSHAFPHKIQKTTCIKGLLASMLLTLHSAVPSRSASKLVFAISGHSLPLWTCPTAEGSFSQFRCRHAEGLPAFEGFSLSGKHHSISPSWASRIDVTTDNIHHVRGRCAIRNRREVFFCAHLSDLDLQRSHPSEVSLDGVMMSQASVVGGGAGNKQKQGSGSDDDLPSVRSLGKPQRYRLTISYEGKHFHGWQKQHPPGQEPLRTVQEVLEAVIRQTLRQKVRCHSAGRTDAGVSALGQVVQFDAVTSMSVSELVEKFNAALPGDIKVKEASEAAPKFSAMDSLWKRCAYTISDADCIDILSREVQNEGKEQACVLKVEPEALDVGVMQHAGKMLVGTRDFAGFQSKGGRNSTVRTLFRCDVTRKGCSTRVVMEGDGFLYKACRICSV
eukprot:TRINITY_DN13352_c0_g1_i1.p1 TRINITY_DN13352_c0_g1~~TRINITY_DN13352_c0_g1_i1.p1  ORF type:complete len:399 (+),score=37.25 TRINITY_DN13352_c0_g1_i1:323-1519(+)